MFFVIISYSTKGSCLQDRNSARGSRRKNKIRVYRYKGLRLQIAPEVFHPGFYFSTQFLLQHISSMKLKGKNFLELGCGSGLISMVAVQKEAGVTATDINPVAVEFLKENCLRNKLQMKIFKSDMFDEIPEMQYDIIAINPPYYKKDPVTLYDHAWFCGANGEYFSNLFQSLHSYIHPETDILMILFDGCDMEMIHAFAAANNFVLACVHRKINMLEKNFIYKIERK